MLDHITCQPVSFSDEVESAFQTALGRLRSRTDDSIFWLLVFQWAFITFAVTVASQPFHIPFETFALIITGTGILTVTPLAMLLQKAGTWQTRWAVVASQGCLSSLLWCGCDGRFEAQLHLISWVVVLARYRDVTSLMALVTIAWTGDAIVFAICPSIGMMLSDDWSMFIWRVGLVAETSIMVAFVLMDRQAARERLHRDAEIASLQLELVQAKQQASQATDLTSHGMSDPLCELLIANAGEPEESAAGREMSVDADVLLVAPVSPRRAAAVGVLDSANYVTLCVDASDSAYAALEAAEYEYVLVDVDLPDDEGYRTVEAIRTQSTHASQRIYAITDKLTPDQILRCTQAGVDGILLNPLSSEGLRQMLSGGNSFASKGMQGSHWNWNCSGLTRRLTAAP